MLQKNRQIASWQGRNPEEKNQKASPTKRGRHGNIFLYLSEREHFMA